MQAERAVSQPDIGRIVQGELGRSGWSATRSRDLGGGLLAMDLVHPDWRFARRDPQLILVVGLGSARQLNLEALATRREFGVAPLCVVVLPSPLASATLPGAEIDVGLDVLGTPSWSRRPLDEMGALLRDFLASRVPGAADAGHPAEPGLGVDRIAAAMVRLVDGVVAEARDREEQDESLITVGIYGPWGAGKSTLMRAIRSRLPAEDYLCIAVNPWQAGETGSFYGYFRARTLDHLTSRFLGIRSRTAIRAMLWLTNHPWMYGLAALLVLLVLALMLDPSLSWKMVDDVYHAWRTAKTGEEVRAVQYIMEWYPIGMLLQAAPWVSVGVPLAVKWAPFLLRRASTKFQVVAASGTTEDLQSLYRDLVRLAKSENRTLVFFVDDLDRCTPARVAEFVESIHSLTTAGCVAFIACDDDYVSAALNAKYKEVVAQHRDGTGFGRSFLSKIVQVPFRVPMVGEAAAGAGLTGAVPFAPAADLDEARLGAILDEAVGAFVRPLGLNIHFLKSLVGTIKLHLDIGGFAGEAEARRLAAAVFADSVDPAWLDAHALRQEAPRDSALALYGDLAARLRQTIGDDEGELRRIYQRLGRRPRLAAKTPNPAFIEEEAKKVSTSRKN